MKGHELFLEGWGQRLRKNEEGGRWMYGAGQLGSRPVIQGKREEEVRGDRSARSHFFLNLMRLTVNIWPFVLLYTSFLYNAHPSFLFMLFLSSYHLSPPHHLLLVPSTHLLTHL